MPRASQVRPGPGPGPRRTPRARHPAPPPGPAPPPPPAGASGYGWFFRYLTFCVFTLQLAQALLALVSDLGLVPALGGLVDDVSCAAMPLANVVTVMYYLVDALTPPGALVEGGKHLRPSWLAFMVHQVRPRLARRADPGRDPSRHPPHAHRAPRGAPAPRRPTRRRRPAAPPPPQGNTLYAWLDVALSSGRTFRPGSRSGIVAFSVGYSAWVNVIKAATGSFPYPFLDKLPQPFGIAGMIAVACVFAMLFWALGRRLAAGLAERGDGAAGGAKAKAA